MLFNTDDGPARPRRPAGCRRRRRRRASALRALVASATCSPRSRRRSCSASGPRTIGRHRRHRRRGDVRTERAKTTARAVGPTASTHVDAAEVFAEHLAGIVRPTTCSSAPPRTATASSTSATTRGSSSRARPRRLRGPAVAVVLDRPARPRAGVGRHDRRVQRPDGRAQFVVISCAGCGWPASPRSDTPFRCPRSGRPGDDVDHVLVRRLTRRSAVAGGRRAQPVRAVPHPALRVRPSGRRLPARRRHRAAR